MIDRFRWLRFPLSGLVVFVAGASEPGPPERSETLFALEIQPMLSAKCAACHGQDPAVLLAELDVTSREGLLRGGQSGEPALVPGNAGGSALFQAVSGDAAWLPMPPKENDRLSQEQVALLREWIDLGAAWPSPERAESIRAATGEWGGPSGGVEVPTSGGQTDEWTRRRYKPEDVWAFRPVEAPPVPDVEASNPVDAFHRAALDGAGVEPASRAERLTLLRRASYGLTGLPPTPEQAREFLGDTSPGAWDRLVDRLLASPGYGEQWGRHWLDVVRYADTAGNSNDYERSNAWRYRDYVIRAFNRDKPYDRFVKEQLAGDELDPSDPEMVVATGFLRMGPWGSAMVPKKMARQAYLDDVVHSVGQAFLSLPLRCAKCHDHKADPVPTRDYYRIYAALATTQMAEREAPFLPDENLAGFESGREHVAKLRDFASQHKQVLERKIEDAAREWFAERGRPYVPEKQRTNLPDEEKPPRHYGLSSEEEGRLKVRRQDEWIWTRRLERYRPLAQTVFNGPDYVPGNGRKLRVPEKLDLSWRPDSAILDGGSVHAPGESVWPGVLSAAQLPTVHGGGRDEYALPDDLAGRRLALAEWIVDPRNPLTARSIVNRVWSYHFGRGIVATPNNFGAFGSKPVNPELLDWLAADCVAGGWSLKRLHRTIMGSEAYRQSGERADMDQVRELDPENRLLAYFEPRRMAAEELRDSLLLAAGEMTASVGGVPAKPEINLDVALQPRMIQFSIAPAYQPSRTPRERNRRSIYAYKVRGQADPLMQVFNQPSPNDSCERRDSSSVSPQALTLMNSDYAARRSIAFARRLEAAASDVASQIDRAFWLAYSRAPEPELRGKLADFVSGLEREFTRSTPEPPVFPTRITRSLVEEFTGAPFEYEEWLPVYEDYVRDPGPADVSERTRALAELCLLLINSNEFAYVY